MQTIKQLITAASGYASSIGGRTLMVQGCDQGSVLSVTLTDSFGNRETVSAIGAGAKLTPAAGFTSVQIGTTVDANVQFIVTNGDIDVQLSQLGSTINNTNLNPVPVAIVSEPGAPFQVSAPVGQEVNVKVQGSVAVTGATLTATNVGINNTTANPVPVQDMPRASAPTDVAPVAFNAAPGTVLVAAAAARRGLRIRNAGPGKLAVTAAAGTTFANAAVVLQVGDVWNETDAPQAAWYAVSDSTATANIQTVA